MTTMLVLVVDPPTAALHHDDPITWTAGHVRTVLLAAGLVVHDVAQRPELILGAERPPDGFTATEQHVCPLPWCARGFSASHLLKMHMRSHTPGQCRHCGGTFMLTGLHSHEQRCAKPTPETPPPPRVRVPKAKAPTPEAPPVVFPKVGPMARRPFDPDRVRAAAFSGIYDTDADPFR